MKKQGILIIVFSLLVLPIINANLIEVLQDFESKSCGKIDNEGGVSSLDLARFGLNSGAFTNDGCIMLFDIYPFSTGTEELGNFFQPIYADLYYFSSSADSTELINDGEFEFGRSYWSENNGDWSLSLNLGYAITTDNLAELFQNVNTNSRVKYKLKISARSFSGLETVTQNNLRVTLDSGTPIYINLTEGFKCYQEEIVAGANSNAGLVFTSLLPNISIDSVSLKENTEYLLFFAKDSEARNNLVSLVGDYENHAILQETKGISFPEEYFLGTTISDSRLGGCSDIPNSNIYSPNSLTYTTPISGQADSFCDEDSQSEDLVFPYCDGDKVDFTFFSCNCDINKCIPQGSEIIYWIKNFGTNNRPTKKLIDNDFVKFAVSLWINS